MPQIYLELAVDLELPTPTPKATASLVPAFPLWRAKHWVCVEKGLLTWEPGSALVSTYISCSIALHPSP